MTRSRCFALLTMMVAGVGVACGGSVGIGTLALEDAGGSAPPSDSGPSGTIDGSTLPTACNGKSGVEVLLDAATTGDEGVTDFFGDGTDVFAGINYIGGFRAGRITKLPANDPRSAVIELSPAYVRGIAPGLDRVFFGMIPDVSAMSIGVAPRTGGTPTTAEASQGATLIATHPLRAEGFFVVTSDAGSTHQEIRSWNTSEPPSTVMVLPRDLTVRSLSASATTLAVVVQDHSTFLIRYTVLTPKPGAPANPDTIVSWTESSIVSNVIADSGGSVFLGVSRDGGDLSLLRFDGTNKQLSDGVSLGSIPIMPPEGAHIEVDDKHVYLAHGARAVCDKSPCTTSLGVVRMKKDGPATTAAPVKVKEFIGAAPDEIGYRSFNVDACWFTWYDHVTRTLSRQSKSSL